MQYLHSGEKNKMRVAPALQQFVIKAYSNANFKKDVTQNTFSRENKAQEWNIEL